ncbi:MAG: zinc-dependent metalloprotease [Saprospiraceae bacterium]|nr:zinc-dependent metalloprotease [Saprospiraceae bacterium]MCF8251394.1 zinc-dependent metalloprotease [Saprospiraceae bacterium]MCF8312668.1 zinc-dependent metalloprotease [Saprospiraceae bacterium]MCF8441066.1 zinc-dependent metalloprotease [Saprospiraceae bacterium]
MSKRIKFGALLAAAIIFTSVTAHAQRYCGVSTEMGANIMEQMQSNRNEMRDYVHTRGAITYVPVRFFLVANSDGTGRASERAGLQTLCHLNENYLDQDIQFYLKEFKYINSNSIYSDPMSFSGSNAIANQMIYNAMNIFIVHEMSEEGVLAYYQPDAGPNGNDWIVSLENSVGTEPVISHEVGHFFSLNHTFYGWECSGGWDEAVHGNPVGSFGPCGQPNEKVNMSNCSTSGDAICDTPADYMFPNNNCAYTQNAKDVNGQLLSPDIHNFMNYVYGCSDYHFSDDQKTEIQNSLFSSNRNYIRPNYTPNLAAVTGTPTIVSPQNNETISTYNAVPLEWTAVPGADKYSIKLTIPNVSTTYVVVNSNSVVLSNLTPNTNYLWNVVGFNEYSTCGGTSGQKIFKTGDQLSDTFTIPELASWNLSPNPVRVGTPFFINIETTASIQPTISIYNMTGQLVMEFPSNEFKAGESSFEVATSDLTAGIYFVTLRTENDFQTQRLSVVE